MRTVLVAISLLLSLSVSGEYRLILADGSSLIVDTPPEVRNGAVYFSVHGSPSFLPIGGVDLAKTESANIPPSPAAAGAPGTAPAPRKFTDEDLQRSSARDAPPPAIQNPRPEEGAVRGASDWDRRAALAQREKGLRERKDRLEERLDAATARRRALDEEDSRRRADYAILPTDPYAVAASQDWGEEYRRRASSLDAERAGLTAEIEGLDRQIRSVQEQIRDLLLAP